MRDAQELLAMLQKRYPTSIGQPRHYMMANDDETLDVRVGDLVVRLDRDDFRRSPEYTFDKLCKLIDMKGDPSP